MGDVVRMNSQLPVAQFQEFLGVAFARWTAAFRQDNQPVSRDIVLTDCFAESLFRDTVAI